MFSLEQESMKSSDFWFLSFYVIASKNDIRVFQILLHCSKTSKIDYFCFHVLKNVTKRTDMFDSKKYLSKVDSFFLKNLNISKKERFFQKEKKKWKIEIVFLNFRRNRIDLSDSRMALKAWSHVQSHLLFR